MSFWLFILVFLLAVVSGCIASEKEVNTMEKISISAEAFKDGETIPAKYTCDGKDVSPALSWEGIPAGAKSIALVMDDTRTRREGCSFTGCCLIFLQARRNCLKDCRGTRPLAMEAGRG